MSLQIQRIAIHPLPPLAPAPKAAGSQAAIPFHHYILPFINLIKETVENVLFGTFVVSYYCATAISAAQVVFNRLIFAPPFDPTHPSFKKGIDQLEKQLPDLQKKIDKLEQKFWHGHKLSQDLADLRNLSDEISKAYRQLDTYVRVLERRTHAFPIQDQLTQVRDEFRKLDDQVDDFCLNKGDHILEQSKKAIELFSKGGSALPKDIQTQLARTWQNLEGIFKLRLHNLQYFPSAHALHVEFVEIKKLMKVLSQKTQVNVADPLRPTEPLKLDNIGNSCYLDAVLQCVMAIAHIRAKLAEPLEKTPGKTSKEYQSELAIQQGFAQFLDMKEKLKDEERLSQMDLILFLLGSDPSIYLLREALFKSGFHYDLEMTKLRAQHDSAYIMEVLLDHILTDCKFNWRGYAETEELPGLEFINGGPKGKDENVAILQLGLFNRPSHQKLDFMLKAQLGKHWVKDHREFDVSEGMVVKGKEEEAADTVSSVTGKQKVDKFCEWFRLTKLPPVLTIQFKRFKYDPITNASLKVDLPVILPDDGIVDLSKYYDAPTDGPQKALYRIKGMVQHSGGKSANSGHYTASVEINGKCFTCNDSPSVNKEISKKQFLDQTDPYLLFLERIPDEEVEKMAAKEKAGAKSKVKIERPKKGGRPKPLDGG